MVGQSIVPNDMAYGTAIGACSNGRQPMRAVGHSVLETHAFSAVGACDLRLPVVARRRRHWLLLFFWGGLSVFFGGAS